MRKADLRVGDRVWVVLPYEGGTGNAVILDLDSTPPERSPSRTVRIEFERGSSAYKREYLVAPDRIIRKSDGD